MADTTKPISEKNPDKSSNDKQTEPSNTLTVVIESNKSILGVLDDWKSTGKIIGVLFILVFTIFIALAFVTIAIKRIYPYNDIKVSTLGAIIMQNEDKEIIYELFNTADLWANSGIKVKAGDILTIRASGRYHTAIHHLVDDARDNKELEDKWISTDGERKRGNIRDSLRAQYRIFKNKPQDALLMQVIREDKQEYLKDATLTNKNDSIIRDSYLAFENTPKISVNEEKNNGNIKDLKENLQKRENFYFIGKEREDLHIFEGGILHFAVNNIVLTNSVIDKMIEFGKANGGVATNFGGLQFGKHPNKDTISDESNEMTYYRDHDYYNAWYDDNVGSFLIVIERKKATN
jgi:hypothetical protein